MADNENNTNPTPASTPTPVRRTIKLKPIQPKAAPGVSLPGVTDAAPVTPAQHSETQGSTQTIKLTPIHPQQPQAEGASTEPVSETASTIRLSPSAPSSIPGAKQTIKLRPSMTSQSPESVQASADSKPVSAQTIKLTPSSPASPSLAKRTIKLMHGPSSNASVEQAAPSPSTNTIDLSQQQSGATSSSTRTVELNGQAQQPASSSPTINLGTAHKRLQIRKVGGEPALPPSVQNAPASFQEAQELKKQKSSSSKQEPGIFFLISSIVALLVIGAIALMFYAQYANMNKGGDINIGIPRYTGSKAAPYVPKGN